MINRELRQAFVLDCCGLKCPTSIVRIGLAMRPLMIGKAIQVRATDPGFKTDLDAWLTKAGHRLLSYEEGQVQKAVIEKLHD